jgi:hypothetical protein
MSNSYTRKPIPVDSRRQDWPRIVAQDLNGIERAYCWAFDLLTPALANEVVHLHTVMQDFSIPYDWGEHTIDGVKKYAGVIASVDVFHLPPALFNFQILLKRAGEDIFHLIGSWFIQTDGSFTANTYLNRQVDVGKGDTIKVVAPPVAQPTFFQACFTFVGSR